MKTIDKQEVLRKIAIKEKRLVELERLEQQSYKMMMKYSRSGNLLRKKIAKLKGNLAMAHGPRRKILYINECNRKITYEVFDQLFSRSEITFLDFNPDMELLKYLSKNITNENTRHYISGSDNHCINRTISIFLV